MFRSQFSVYQRQVDLKEEDRIALLEQWKSTGAKREVWKWFNQEIWLDAQNGDDNNSGSPDSPVATVEEIVNNRVPPGGQATIHLLSDASLHSVILLNGRRIRFVGREGSKTENNPWIEIDVLDDSGKTAGFVTEFFGEIILFSVNLRTPQRSSTDSIWEGFIRRYDRTKAIFMTFNSIIEVNNTSVIRVQSGPSCMVDVSLYNTDIKKLDNWTPIWAEGSLWTLSLKVSNSKAYDSSGNSINWSDVIGGIIKDSNGVPRNIVSNIVF